LVGSVVVLGTSVLAVYATSQGLLSAGRVGLALTYVTQLPGMLGWFLKEVAQTEIELVAVERAWQYLDEPTENDETHLCPTLLYSTSFFDTSTMQFREVVLRYSSVLPPVLKGISVVVPPGKKVLCVGRTGAGKSSLFSTLLRFHPFEGHIRVGDLDICDLMLVQLRHLVHLIPQRPMLFGKTVREILMGPADATLTSGVPQGDFRTCTFPHVSRMQGSRTATGELFSAGEQQLLCLARALYNPAPVLLCDEITSTLDESSDRLVHDILFGMESTVLSIAHNLHNAMRYDLVMVLEDGRVAEFDAPAALVQRPSSRFASLLSAAGRHT
ncbi:uncharacterized protein MONBRDRAFT_15550, partial [Monosiga brevicollis MX1]